MGQKLGEWADLPLQRSKSSSLFLRDESMGKVYRHTFNGFLPNPFTNNASFPATGKSQNISFTLKYRAGPGWPWLWVNIQFGTGDGEIILLPPRGLENTLVDSLQLGSDWSCEKLSSEAIGANLYSIESKQTIPRRQGSDAAMETKTLGRVLDQIRWFALVRIWSPWLGPRHGTDKVILTEDAILCAFLTRNGSSIVLLAMNGISDTLTLFRSDDQGNIVVAARNDSNADVKFHVLAGVASSFEVANRAVMYEARKRVRASTEAQELGGLLPQHTESESVDSDTVLVSKAKNAKDTEGQPTPQWMEGWYDGIAYCTWNSLGQDLSADKIMSALDSFRAIDVHVSSLIIDDNWQSLDGVQGETSQFKRGWLEFEAHKDGFPEGLKAAVTKIRQKHPHVKDVAVWHALLGYWGGISSFGRLAKDYKTIEVESGSGIAGGKRLAIHPDEAHRFYNDFYTFLSSCGITSVKTDVQFYLDLLTSSSDRAAFTTTYQSAWTIAHLRHFAGKAISCMSQIPQILFHSFLPTDTPRILLRNSDDFYPAVPTSHPWHVFCNAHNALFVQHLNVLPDWDMFQTSHPYSGFHAAARCVSGGPIYITDTPREHDVDLIHQMTAQESRGTSVILRPSCVGKTIDAYNNYNDGHVLKVGTYNGAAESGTGILGLFNVSDHEISFLLPVTDFPGIEVQDASTTDKTPDRSFIVRSHRTRQISRPIAPTLPIGPAALVSATLPIRGYDILSAYPVHTLPLASSPVSVAVLGLLGKMTGACAILWSHVALTENGKRLKTVTGLKAMGTLGLWVSDLMEWSVDAGMMVLVRGQVVERECVRISPVEDEDEEEEEERKDGVLEIDIRGPLAGWSNEIVVEVFIG